MLGLTDMSAPLPTRLAWLCITTRYRERPHLHEAVRVALLRRAACRAGCRRFPGGCGAGPGIRTLPQRGWTCCSTARCTARPGTGRGMVQANVVSAVSALLAMPRPRCATETE